MSERDVVFAAEVTMACYAEQVRDEIERLTVERLAGVGGGWGDDAAYYGELLKMRASFDAFPPAAWVRLVLGE